MKGSISTKTTVAETGHLGLAEVEATLLNEPSIFDCAVLERETENSQRELVAYVVPKSSFLLEQLHSNLRAVLPSSMLPSVYVPVSMLPLTPEGKLDEPALLGLEAIDADLVHRWEEQLRSLPEVEQVQVVVQEQALPLPPLPLSDILPEWKATLGVEGNDQPVVAVSRLPSKKGESGSNRLAICHGEPLQREASTPTTLPEALKRAALQASAKGLVYIQSDGSESVQSYADLLEEVQRILAGLRKLGLKPQDKVIFQLDRHQDFIPAFWACGLGGFVPVPVSIAPTYEEVNSDINKLCNAWQMLEQPLVLTNAKLAPSVRSLSELLSLEGFRVETVDALRAFDPDCNWYVSQPDDLALLLLTSGSTGVPKMVMQSHRSLLNRSAATSQMNRFSRDDVSLNWFPLDHVGGLVMFHIRDVYLGCQQVHAPTESVLKQPLKWLDWIERYRATITWAPNFAYERVNSRLEEVTQENWNLSSLRFLLNGGEAIVAKQARKFLQLLAPYGLSATAMHPAWGMSETCSGVTYSHSFTLDSTTDDDSSVEVGAPIPEISLRVVDSEGKVVEEGTIGRLQVKGPTVTSGYYQNPEANQEAFTDDGWFNTGDLGFLREGRLTLTGRHKEVIIINGLNYYSHEIESAVEALEGIEVSYTAAVAVRDADGSTDKLAIFFSPVCFDEADVAKRSAQIRHKIVHDIGINPEYLIPVKKEAIPRTAIGKIQHSQLKKSFEAGEFNDILQRLGTQLKNTNTIPDWFYRKSWHRKEYTILEPGNRTCKSVIFLDRLGLGELLGRELERDNQPWVGVEAGADFAKLGSNRYCIVPGNREHYWRLFESLAADNIPIGKIVHLWTYDDCVRGITSLQTLEQAQEQGIYSLLFLVQALTGVQSSENRVRLLFVSSHTQCISPGEAIAYEKSAVLGIIKTIPQEMPWITSRHVDLSVDRLEINATRIHRELRVLSGDQEVAYRKGQRLVSCLEKVDLLHEPSQALPFKCGGRYLISGALGGIGFEIAKYLLQHYQARLLLIGTTPLPERSTWHSYQGQTEDAIARRIRNYQTLEQLDGEAIYEVADVSDWLRLQQIVEQVESRWGGELDGVIHLAGILQEGMLSDLSQNALATQLRSSVMGTWVLHQLFKDKTQALFITVSSVNGFFGGTNVGAYAAASSFKDAFAYYQKYHSPLQSYCFSQSMWDDVGMSWGYQMKEASRVRGYYTMTPSQGIYSLQAGLYHNQSQLMSGLDGTNPYIRPYVYGKSESLQKLSAYYTLQSDSIPLDKLQKLVVLDRFGGSSNCDFIQTQKMPLTAKQPGSTDFFEPPMTSSPVDSLSQVQRQIAQIWQEVLELPEVGIDEDFFELGGHSVLMAQVQSKLEEMFGQEVPMVELFRNSTLRSLAQYLTERIVNEPVDSLSQVQRQIAQIWQEVLELPEVGSDEDFFELGGHSVLMAQVQSKLEEMFGQEVPMVELFRNSTLRSLAQYLAAHQDEVVGGR